LIAKFYEIHLIDGVEPPAALWLAQRWLRGLPTWREDMRRAGAVLAAKGPEASDQQQRTARDGVAGARSQYRWDSPVYWAAFVPYGG
jgi:CHAT domain-containing protein